MATRLLRRMRLPIFTAADGGVGEELRFLDGLKAYLHASQSGQEGDEGVGKQEVAEEKLKQKGRRRSKWSE